MTNLKANDVVVMKSGSPMMVLIEVSKGPQKRARCAYWSKTETNQLKKRFI